MIGPRLGGVIEKCGIDKSRKAWHFVKWLFIMTLISVGMLLFKADSLSDAFDIMRIMVRDFRPGWFLAERCYETFASTQQFAIILVSMVVMFVVDWLQKKGKKDVAGMIFSQQLIIRWCIYLLLLYVIVCWGAYGEGFEQTRFIYFEF